LEQPKARKDEGRGGTSTHAACEIRRREEGKEKTDEKLTGGEIRRSGGRADESPLPGVDSAPAAACSLASVPKREGAWQCKGRDSRGEESRRRVNPIHALGQ